MFLILRLLKRAIMALLVDKLTFPVPAPTRYPAGHNNSERLSLKKSGAFYTANSLNELSKKTGSQEPERVQKT